MNEENQTGAPADDVSTIGGIISALYDSISGAADHKRDLRRFRSLFHPEARLMPTRADDDGSFVLQVLDVDEYFKRACEYFRIEGFFEREVARRVDTFGHVTHVFSTYESRRGEEDAAPFARGVNSIQLLRDGDRYRIVTIFWDFERPDSPIPREYLPG